MNGPSRAILPRGLRFALIIVLAATSLSLTACGLWYSILPYGLTHMDSTLNIHSLGGLFTINENYLLETGRLDSRYGIIDVSDPENPVLAAAGGVTFGGSDAVFLKSGTKTYGYLADFGNLRVVDFTSLPASTTLLSTPITTGVQRVDIAGSFLYVALDTGVRVFSLASPQAPSQVQSLNYTDGSTHVVMGAVASDSLFVVCSVRGSGPILRPYTIGSTGTLTAVATTTNPDFMGGELAIKGDVVLAASGADHLVPVDFANPASPTWKDAVDPHDTKYDGDSSFGFSRMTIVNNYLVAYCTEYVDMAIFEISNPRSPVFIFPTLSQDVDLLPAGAQDALCVRQPYIYLAMYNQYLHIFRMP